MKNTNLAIVESAPLKYMPQGKVNGNHTSIRSRYLEMANRANQRTILLSAASFVAGCVVTSCVLWAALYWFV